MKGILEGIRVLDFGRYVSCPYCGLILAGMGAEVIKIENGRGDDTRYMPPYAGDDALMFHCNNRNKKGITLDFRSDEGREILKKLAENVDVIIENFKPGTLEKMGIGYDEISRINPQIIVASITGYGQYGPYKDRPAYDCIVSAIGGLLSINGTKEAGPRLIGIPFLDNTAGVLNALGVVAALLQRAQTGQGCRVDVAMWDLLISYMGEKISDYDKNGILLDYAENMDDPYGCPAGIFETIDGYVYLDCGFDGIFKRFRECVGGVLMEDKYLDYNTRLADYSLIHDATAEWVSTKTTKELDEICAENGIPCGPVNNLDAVVGSENIRVRDMLNYVELPSSGNVGFPGLPIKFSTMAPSEDRRAPELGVDNREVYRNVLNLSNGEIDRLLEKGVIW